MMKQSIEIQLEKIGRLLKQSSAAEIDPELILAFAENRLDADEQYRLEAQILKQPDLLEEFVLLPDNPAQQLPDEIFYPVHCAVCDTRVGVYDKDEVYHFFDVFPSYA